MRKQEETQAKADNSASQAACGVMNKNFCCRCWQNPHESKVLSKHSLPRLGNFQARVLYNTFAAFSVLLWISASSSSFAELPVNIHLELDLFFLCKSLQKQKLYMQICDPLCINNRFDLREHAVSHYKQTWMEQNIDFWRANTTLQLLHERLREASEFLSAQMVWVIKLHFFLNVRVLDFAVLHFLVLAHLPKEKYCHYYSLPVNQLFGWERIKEKRRQMNHMKLVSENLKVSLKPHDSREVTWGSCDWKLFLRKVYYWNKIKCENPYWITYFIQISLILFAF